MQYNLDGMYITHRYAAEVVIGLRKVCKREVQACRRHLRDLERQGTEGFPYVFDESRADRIFDWFEMCCYHVRGPFAGQLIQLLPFQYFDLGCLFGWVHKDTGARRFTKSFNFRARGNVKSTEMSGIALYGMCADAIYPPGHPELQRFEEAPEVECVAVDRDQAKRVWGDACAMGEKSPDISERLEILKTKVVHRERGGWMRALSKETKNKDSGAPCLVIVDEYHAHPNSDIVDTLYNGFGKRWQSLLCIITTAGNDAENNPCKTEYDLCCRILEGLTETPMDNYFCMIRELEAEDDPKDPECWVKANPILQYDDAYSRNLRSQIMKERDEAYGSGDIKKIRAFLTKRCNIWQSGSEFKYMDGLMDKWNSLKVTHDELMELIEGRKAIGGYDLSKRFDLTGATFIVPLDDGRIAILSHGFIPEDSVERKEKKDNVAYREWEKRGWMTVTPGAVVDYDVMKEWAYSTAEQFGLDVVEHCFDTWNADYFMQKMEADGATVVEVRQNVYNLSEPTKRFKELVMQGLIVHEGNAAFDWCLGNAYAYTDINDNMKLSKKNKDDTRRIDMVAACINAMSRLPAFNEMYGDDDFSIHVL